MFTRFCDPLLVVFALLLSANASRAEVDFSGDIQPILSDRCFHCHGPDEKDRQASLRLDRPDGDEGAYAAAIVPGDVEASDLWTRVTSDDPDVMMPPPDSHKARLTKDQLAKLREWIEGGAKYQAHWSFVAPATPTIPAGGERSPIDYFISRRLESEGLQPSPKADRRALIRRVSLDLTGLPPTREEIADFLSDDSPEAYEKVVDRLLSSPHFGEHMARYWLDVVRFADTNGIHHDHFRNLATYRDWVIRAFNENLPYDDFVRYQIAGDLYDNPTQDQLVASGFHRLHMIIDRGTMLPEESYTRNVIDRVTSVGTAFMGLTVGCAVCHDHKYDPLTTKEFYSLFAFFNNIDADPETGGRGGGDFRRGLQDPYINLPTPEQKGHLAQLQEELVAAQAAEKQDDVRAKQRAIDDYMLQVPAAMVMKERQEIRPSHVLTRGVYDNFGEQVSRTTPAFLPPLEIEGDIPSRMDFANWLVDPAHPLTARVTVNRFWQQVFGVGLVQTSEDFGLQGERPSHPQLLDYLASRFIGSGWNVRAVMKEIVMSQTYQQTSSASPGAYTADPQNRLLARGPRFRLDAEVIRDQILATSGLLNEEMYGNSVKPPQPSGLWEAVALPDSYPRVHQASPGDEIYRRSVYTFWKRAMPPPQMTILNAPTREECIARRERTNTPLQALLLMNEEEYLKAARHLAIDILDETGGDPNKTLQAIYETVTCDLPTNDESAKLLSLADDLQKIYEASPDLATAACGDRELPAGISPSKAAAWTMVTSSVYNIATVKAKQ